MRGFGGVEERGTHDIGIRMPLGANRARVLRSVLGQTCFLAIVGIFIGGAAAEVAIHFIQGILYGVTAQGTLFARWRRLVDRRRPCANVR